MKFKLLKLFSKISLQIMSLFFTFVVSPQTKAMPFVLVCHENTSEDSYNRYLNQNDEAISYIEFLKVEKGRLKSSQLDIESENNDVFLNDISRSFLSSLQKSRLVNYLSTIHHKSLNYVPLPQLFNSSSIDDLQIKSVTEGILKHPGSLSFPIEVFRNDDQVYINGFFIKNNLLSTIKFHPLLYYHIAYLSNVYQSHFQWSKGDSIKPIPKIKLISGDCQSSYWEENVTDWNHSMHALFPLSCLGPIASTKNHSPSFFDQTTPKELSLAIKEDPTPPYSYWKDHPLITIAGSLLVFNLLQKELQKNSKNQFSWQTTF